MSQKLPISFYQRPDVIQISKELLGKKLCTKVNGKTLTSGIITETEAYCGRNDKACHANDGRRTKRTEIMYHTGGVAYVYLCYGIHYLFNVVTNESDKADAILVRAIQPVDGIKLMMRRRKMDECTPALTGGPARLTQALGIQTDHYGTNLDGNSIWIEEVGEVIEESIITASPRVGVAYAGGHAKRNWRFFIKNSKWISTKKNPSY